MGRNPANKARPDGDQLRPPAPNAGYFASFLPKAARNGTGAFTADALTIYALLAGLLLATFLLGMRGVGLTRPLFILGSVAVAWRAYRSSPARHIEVVIIIFAFAAFLRRIVDLNVGFDPSGTMLVAPLLALAVPLPELRFLLIRHDLKQSVYVPYAIMLVCISYGWAVSAFQGSIVSATTMGLKMYIPLLYAMYIIMRADDCEEIMLGATRAFLFIAPIMSLYGIWQFLAPQPWDRDWMLNTASVVDSMGKPEPMQVRVFSTMNSPVSFAAFLSCGMLLLGFCRRGWLSIVFLALAAVGMLLSSVRGAWMAVAICVIFCTFFNATRGRAITLTVCLVASVLFAILLTPLGDTISDRLSTFLTPSKDYSGHERLLQYINLYSDQDTYLVGRGLSGFDKMDRHLVGVDGQLVFSPYLMGIFIGNIHVIALIWAYGQGLLRWDGKASPTWLVAGGIVAANIILLPLVAVSAGEVGFGVWAFAALLTAKQIVVARSTSENPPSQQRSDARLRLAAGRSGLV